MLRNQPFLETFIKRKKNKKEWVKKKRKLKKAEEESINSLNGTLICASDIQEVKSTRDHISIVIT